MSAVTDWTVTPSVRHPGRWLVYGRDGDKVMPGITFRTECSAMRYVESKLRWHR